MSKRISFFLCFLFSFVATIALSLATVHVVFAEDASTSLKEANESSWTVDDFTFGPFEYETEGKYEFEFYGCDYSRKILISGRAVTGLSDSGKVKLAAGNTNLKLPRVDADGETLVGISRGAFEGCGFESVSFPTGMKTDYEDKLTKNVTRRGNYVIGVSAFYKNKLTEVDLPDGVLAVGTSAFGRNQITKVTLPRTIWWVENMSFAHNSITSVIFPQTSDFQLEIHGMAFADNLIKSVRLPDFTAVVNKDAFSWNPGTAKLIDSSSAAERYKTVPAGQGMVSSRVGNACGLVYMYTDNPGLATLDRIHTTDRATADTHSYTQKLITTFGAYESDEQWLSSDFTFIDDTNSFTATVTGFSESGIAKLEVNGNVEFPETSPSGNNVTAIEGVFSYDSSSDKRTDMAGKFKSITLPTYCERLGDNAFRESGAFDVAINNKMKEIGATAFQMCNLSSLILPDSVVTIGAGAFATNPDIADVSISKGMTEIPDSFVGCSTKDEYCENFTSLEIPSNITKIGDRAFAGNNIHAITIPASVTSIGDYAFSTKNYLSDPCTLTLNEGLVSIGKYAFRNKVITDVSLPTTVTALPGTTFVKEYTNDGSAVAGAATTVYVSKGWQYRDKENFPSNESQIIVFKSASNGDPSFFIIEGSTIKGLSETGKSYVEANGSILIPACDADGEYVTAIADTAFKGIALGSVEIEDGIATIGESAFESCEIDSLELPSSLSSIGASAFANNKISSVEISANIPSIPESCFANNSLTYVNIKGHVESIGANAFANNSSLTSVVLDEGLAVIGAKAFSNTAIKTAELPTTVTVLPKDTFAGNDEVVALYTRNEAQLTDSGTFFATGEKHKVSYSKLATTGWTLDDFEYGEGSLTGFSASGKEKRKTISELVLPDETKAGATITVIEGYKARQTDDQGNEVDEGNFVFGCPDYEVDWSHTENVVSPYGFTSVVFPKNLERIEKAAFQYDNLTELNLPAGVTHIGEAAFKGNKLTSIALSDRITECGAGAFASNSITEATLSNSMSVIPQGFLSNNIRLTSIEIPNCVTEIGESAFAGDRLTELNIPSSVKKIGKKAFHLHRLTTLTIPGTVKEIGENAFEGTFKYQSLKTLVIEDGVESIGDGAFKEGLLTEVKLPTSVKTFGKKVFENNSGTDVGCENKRVKVIVTDSAQQAFQNYTESGATVEDTTLKIFYEDPNKPSNPDTPSNPDKPSNPDTPSNPDSNKTETVAMYRLYNPNSGEHFYTADAGERANVLAAGWNDEGIGWTAPKSSKTSVYRLYNENGGEHHYTLNEAEKNNLVNVGWNYEGIGWYSDDAQSVPLYRQYNPNAFANNHNYTTDKSENDWLISLGWQGEGIGWYGVKV